MRVRDALCRVSYFGQGRREDVSFDEVKDWKWFKKIYDTEMFDDLTRLLIIFFNSKRYVKNNIACGEQHLKFILFFIIHNAFRIMFNLISPFFENTSKLVRFLIL